MDPAPAVEIYILTAQIIQYTGIIVHSYKEEL
jgi:hypothetical protein